MASTIKVLYIDDEENNLNAFKASFRRQYEIYTASSAAEGMEYLQHIDLHVIIADQKMPNMTGSEFFKTIAETHPDPMRILLTGYTDIEALADAINLGHIYRYITKPWSDLELHNAIKNAYDAYKSKIDLRNKIAELQKTNDELNRFIYSISHELRAPLVSVMGIINLVKLEEQNTTGKEYWDMVETCSKRLDYYILKTIEYYKNSKSFGEKSQVDFQQLINQILEIYTVPVNDVDFDINIKQDEIFVGDKFRIEIILSNLISNAVKYQKLGNTNKRVTINVDVNAHQANITISDNGMGILQEHLEKIFNQFFKSKTSYGSGLGLYIVKEALDKIKGKITVSSQLEQGTVFNIAIPNG